MKITAHIHSLLVALLLLPFISGCKHTISANAGAKVNQVHPSDNELLYFGFWTQDPDSKAPDRRKSNHAFAACEITFRGQFIRFFGASGPEQGFAIIYLDGNPVDTIDAYAPSHQANTLLFERDDLSTDRIHSLKIVVLRMKNGNANNSYQSIDGFEVEEVVNYPLELRSMAMQELKAISLGKKKYLSPEEWKPVGFAASAPMRGVRLLNGPLKKAFDCNVAYVLRSADHPVTNNWWVNALPASSEGRLLGAAAYSLCWQPNRPDLRNLVNDLVDSIGHRQLPNGYCLPYDSSYMYPMQVNQPGRDERRNYDRVNFTRGLIGAGKSGNRNAYLILRRFYDWLNQSQIYPTLLTGSYDGSGHNCNNGHAGGLLMYFSPLGKPEDLVNPERYFVQDFFIDQMKNREPLALGYYPYHVAHSYVLLAYEAWLDHYRATGHQKYLEAALGAWEVVHQHYQHIGGSIAICEDKAGSYPPQSYFTRKHTGETCGSVFWADINHRLLQHFPHEERFANEIEKTLYNVILAAQDSAGNIRYHCNLHGKKDLPRHENTCCEVNGAPFISRIPGFIYSLDAQGLWVNLYAASTISWDQGGDSIQMVAQTDFPQDSDVRFILKMKKNSKMALRFRIPGWLTNPVDIEINGDKAASGVPGTYQEINRIWKNGDRISMEIPLTPRLVQYSGFDQHPEYDRYALQMGPVLMALVGSYDLQLEADELIPLLEPMKQNPLWYKVTGHPECHFQPYWTIGMERMTCLPVFTDS